MPRDPEATELREGERSEEMKRRRKRQTLVEQVAGRKPVVLEEPRRDVNEKLRNLLE
jgi:hypothetical protein